MASRRLEPRPGPGAGASGPGPIPFHPPRSRRTLTSNATYRSPRVTVHRCSSMHLFLPAPQSGSDSRAFPTMAKNSDTVHQCPRATIPPGSPSSLSLAELAEPLTFSSDETDYFGRGKETEQRARTHLEHQRLEMTDVPGFPLPPFLPLCLLCNEREPNAHHSAWDHHGAGERGAGGVRVHPRPCNLERERLRFLLECTGTPGPTKNFRTRREREREESTPLVLRKWHGCQPGQGGR